MWWCTNIIVSHYSTAVYMTEPRAEINLYSLNTWTHNSPFHSVDSTSIPKIWSWPHPLPSLLVFLCLCSDGIQFQTVSRCWLLAAVTLLSRGQRTCHQAVSSSSRQLTHTHTHTHTPSCPLSNEEDQNPNQNFDVFVIPEVNLANKVTDNF